MSWGMMVGAFSEQNRDLEVIILHDMKKFQVIV